MMRGGGPEALSSAAVLVNGAAVLINGVGQDARGTLGHRPASTSVQCGEHAVVRQLLEVLVPLGPRS